MFVYFIRAKMHEKMSMSFVNGKQLLQRWHRTESNELNLSTTAAAAARWYAYSETF